MTWILGTVVAIAAGVAIGRAHWGARHARQQFIGHMFRSRANLRAWIALSIRTAALATGLGLVLYAAYRLAIV